MLLYFHSVGRCLTLRKQSVIVVGIIAFLLALSVGYALFSETITINGTATAKGNFDVEFTNAIITNEVGSTGSSAVISTDKNSLDITVPKLEYPGAYAEISVTVTNRGTIPAILNGIEENGLINDTSIKISYAGLKELKDQTLNQNGTQTFTIKVMWDESSNVSSSNVKFTIKLNYEQVTL